MELGLPVFKYFNNALPAQILDFSEPFTVLVCVAFRVGMYGSGASPIQVTETSEDTLTVLKVDTQMPCAIVGYSKRILAGCPLAERYNASRTMRRSMNWSSRLRPPFDITHRSIANLSRGGHLHCLTAFRIEPARRVASLGPMGSYGAIGQQDDTSCVKRVVRRLSIRRIQTKQHATKHCR